MSTRLGLQFENHFDFTDCAAGEGRHSYCGAGAFAVFFAEDIDDQLAAAVDHFGMTGEIVGAVDHASGLNQPSNSIEGTQFVAEGGQQGEAALAGCRCCLFDFDVPADFAGHHLAVHVQRNMARKLSRVSNNDELFIDRERG